MYSPYPQSTNRGLPAGHNVIMTPYGYPPVLMPPQQGIAAQPHATMASSFMPIGGINNYYNYTHAYIFVGSCLATKVFIGNLPAMGMGWVIIK